jgi:hypothetical protein
MILRNALLASRLAGTVGGGASTDISPAAGHEHDIHDVYVPITVQIIAGIVVGIALLRAPAPGNEHDVQDVHVAVAIHVSWQRRD